MDLPPSMTEASVRRVFSALEAAGGEGCVRFVGGSVRDVVMGRAPGDIDLATQLSPDETEAALTAAAIRHAPTGKAFGTITAVVDKKPYEITSLREDVETDGRRAVVSFTRDWAKDAQRRDFYLNALYADIRGTVYDPTGEGLADARAGRVRFIGDATIRLREDYLRILRFFRFSAGYARELDAVSLRACVELKSGIRTLSGERIAQELLRLLAVPDPVPVVKVMIGESVMTEALGGLEVSGEVLPSLCGLSDEAEIRLAGLLYPKGRVSENLQAVVRRLRLSNRLSRRLKILFEYIDSPELSDLPKALYRLGPQAVRDIRLLRAAIEVASPEQWREAEAQIFDPPVFPLKATDLLAVGLEAGPELGRELKRIEGLWLDNAFSQDVITNAVDEIRKRTKI